MRLRIKVTPKSSSDEIVGWEDDGAGGRLLRVRLKAPPVDGKANEALVRFLAKHLGVPKSQVAIVQGATSRVKTLDIPDGTLE